MNLEVTRTLPARRAVVFRAFTVPEAVAGWWGPEGFVIPRLSWTPSVGAVYRIEMQPPEGEAFHLAGEFTAVEPDERLALTFVWEPADPDDVETVADLSFRGAGESTEVVLVQGPFKTEERRELHRGGWTESFAKLERFLKQG